MRKINSSYVKICESSCPLLARISPASHPETLNCYPRQYLFHPGTPCLPTTSLPPSNNPRNIPAHPLTRQVVNQNTSPPSTLQLSCPTKAPSPRVLAIPSIITANTPTAPHVHIHDLQPTPSRTHSKLLTITNCPAHAVPIVEPDDEQDKVPTMRPATPPCRSIQIITN